MRFEVEDNPDLIETVDRMVTMEQILPELAQVELVGELLEYFEDWLWEDHDFGYGDDYGDISTIELAEVYIKYDAMTKALNCLKMSVGEFRENYPHMLEYIPSVAVAYEEYRQRRNRGKVAITLDWEEN